MIRCCNRFEHLETADSGLLAIYFGSRHIRFQTTEYCSGQRSKSLLDNFCSSTRHPRVNSNTCNWLAFLSASAVWIISLQPNPTSTFFADTIFFSLHTSIFAIFAKVVASYVLIFPTFSSEKTWDVGSNPAWGNLPVFSDDEYVGKIKTYLLFLSSYESFPASKNTYLFVPNLVWGYEAWDVLKWRKYWAPGILTL